MLTHLLIHNLYNEKMFHDDPCRLEIYAILSVKNKYEK